MIKLYHISKPKYSSDYASLCRSIYTKGLVPHDNGEANAVWWSVGNPYSDYFSNGNVVLMFSMECDEAKMKKYDISISNPNAWSHLPIPFSELKVEIAPLFITNKGGIVSSDKIDFFLKCYKRHGLNFSQSCFPITVYTDILYPLVNVSIITEIENDERYMKTRLFNNESIVITESDINILVKESIKRILEENYVDEFKAYHGSASNFDEFSLDYWHSGEGSNVYGKGIYLSGCYDTAAHYARSVGKTYGMHDTLGYGDDTNLYGDNKFAVQRVLWDVADLMYNNKCDLDTAIRMARNEYMEKYLGNKIWCLDYAIDWNRVSVNPDKYIYTVDIPSLKENKYWYYNAPIDDNVKGELASALYDVVLEKLEGNGKKDEAHIQRVEEMRDNFMRSKITTSDELNIWLYDEGFDAEEYFTNILKRLGYIGVVVPIGFKHGAPKGVKGNNFVIFDPKNIKIKKKEVFK